MDAIVSLKVMAFEFLAGLCGWNHSLIHGKAVKLIKNITLTEYFSSLLFKGEILSASPAILDEDQVKYTFGSLEDISTRLAKILRTRLGFWTTNNPDNDLVIAFCLNSHEHVIVLILAILKLGCTYLALEPYYPEHELIPIISLTRPMLIITETSGPIRNRFDSLKSFTEIDSMENLMNSSLQLLSDLTEVDPLESLIKPHLRPATIIFTSGTTGFPLGCRMGHGAILNRVLWQLKQLPYSNDEVLVCCHSISDADCVGEMFCPLFGGRPLSMIHRSILTKPATFLLRVSQLSVTRITLTPKYFALFLSFIEELGPDAKDLIKTIKYVSVVGDVLSHELGIKFFNLFKDVDCCLVIMYGATETASETVFEVFKDMEDFLEKVENSVNYSLVPVGAPIYNVSLCILDDNNKIVPQGVVGEIYVSGPCLSYGFVKTSKTSKSLRNMVQIGPKLYFGTSDLGRVSSDKRGNKTLNFEGRLDDIANIHGRRINMNNIKQAVENTQLVQDCQVCLGNPDKEIQTIFAAVILKENVKAQEVLEKLKPTVASHMIPEIYPMTEFPTLSTGRINKRRLLSIYQAGKMESTPEDWQPLKLDAEQKQAARILCDAVSSATGISVRFILSSFEENFFDIGGTSLNCVYACTLCRESGYFVSLPDFVKAKNFKDILNKMVLAKVNPRSTFQVSECQLSFEVVPLGEKHRHSLIDLLSTTYAIKGDIMRHIKATREDFHNMLSASWKVLNDDNLGLVAIDSASSKVIACSLNVDANRKLALKKMSTRYNYRWQLLQYCETAPRKTTVAPGKRKVVQVFMMGTEESVSPDDNITLIQSLLNETINKAIENGYSFIMITTANALVRQLCKVMRFDVLAEVQINNFVAKDKTKPFRFAADVFAVRVLYRKLL